MWLASKNCPSLFHHMFYVHKICCNNISASTFYSLVSDPHCIQMLTILRRPEFGWLLYFFFSWEIWSCQLSRATCDCPTRSPPTWRSSSCRRSRLRRAQSRTTPPSSSRASRKISTHTWRTGLPSHSSRSWGPTSWLPRAEWQTLLLAIGNKLFCLI